MISIVVPVYNEGETIGDLIGEVARHVRPPYEVLIVYDRDDDNTIPRVKDLVRNKSSDQNRIRLIRNSIKRGPSGALRQGFQDSVGDVVLVTMADLSDDLSQVETMRNWIAQGFDIVCPSRYCAGGDQDLNSIKAWIPRWVGRALRWLTNFPSYDATNSFRLYSRTLLKAFPIRSTHSFSVTLEIAAKAHVLDYRLIEIPTKWKVRRIGQSKFPFITSLGSYLPWFFLALTRNRFFSLPISWRRRLADL